jgi:hypothetical protein
VLALRAALEAPVAVGDAPLERLVVAGVEVQAVDVLDRAPVAAEGGLALGSIAISDAAMRLLPRQAVKSSQWRAIVAAARAKKSRVRYGVE